MKRIETETLTTAEGEWSLVNYSEVINYYKQSPMKRLFSKKPNKVFIYTKITPYL